jgi:hypothetical protein
MRGSHYFKALYGRQLISSMAPFGSAGLGCGIVSLKAHSPSTRRALAIRACSFLSARRRPEMIIEIYCSVTPTAAASSYCLMQRKRSAANKLISIFSRSQRTISPDLVYNFFPYFNYISFLLKKLSIGQNKSSLTFIENKQLIKTFIVNRSYKLVLPARWRELDSGVGGNQPTPEFLLKSVIWF